MSEFPEDMPTYFVRFTTGLVSFVKEELAEIGVQNFIQEDQRTLLFTYYENVSNLLNLKSVDDVFVFCGNFHNVKHTRDALPLIREQASSLELKKSSKYCYDVRGIKPNPSFKITVTLLGKRNYNRFEVEEYIRQGLVEKIDWQFVKNEPGMATPDFDLRILMEGEHVLVGIRLGENPLHRRGWKQHNMHGSLKPPVAWAMAKAAGIETTDHMLDPMCGVGTTLIAAAMAFSPASIAGVDRNPEALSCAKKNAALAKVTINFQEGNTLEKQIFPAQSFDKILCNLPWGKQIKIKGTIEAMYQDALQEFFRLLNPDGNIVVLTDQIEALENAVRKIKHGNITHRYPLRLFGSGPVIFVIKKV